MSACNLANRAICVKTIHALGSPFSTGNPANREIDLKRSYIRFWTPLSTGRPAICATGVICNLANRAMVVKKRLVW